MHTLFMDTHIHGSYSPQNLLKDHEEVISLITKQPWLLLKFIGPRLLKKPVSGVQIQKEEDPIMQMSLKVSFCSKWIVFTSHRNKN